MEYISNPNNHVIKMDDNEIQSLCDALDSCHLTERRTFYKLLKHLKDGTNLLD